MLAYHNLLNLKVHDRVCIKYIITHHMKYMYSNKRLPVAVISQCKTFYTQNWFNATKLCVFVLNGHHFVLLKGGNRNGKK